MRWLGLVLAALLATQAAAQSSVSYPPVDTSQFATAGTVVDVENVLTDSQGNIVGTWQKVKFSSPPAGGMATARVINVPINCQMAPATDSLNFSGHCWQIVPATVQGVVSTLSAVVASTYQNAAAGIPVTVYGRQ